MEKRQKVLIITSSGGGGLIQAAYAIQQQMEETCSTKVVDIMKKWTFGVGHCFVFIYDSLQRWGKVGLLEAVVRCQKYSEKILWPFFFCRFLYTLYKNHYDRVIDTQPLCSSALIKAMRLYNWGKKKNLYLEKILVDLPTKKCVHFFANIKKLSPKDRDLLQLSTIRPLLEQEKTEQEFWLKHTKLSLSQIKIVDFFIRKSFFQYLHKKRDEPSFTICIREEKNQRKDLMKKAIDKTPIACKEIEEGFLFTIQPEDKVFVIILGSQAAQQATLDYVQNFVFCMKKLYYPTKKYRLFVFCPNKTRDVLKEIVTLIEEDTFFPSHLSIIPMSFQKEDTIARLFYRSDLSITRTGGQTAMELLGVSSGTIWIHSESKKANLPIDEEVLLEGIPAWEAGNAKYLIKKHRAKIVTPGLILHQAETFI